MLKIILVIAWPYAKKFVIVDFGVFAITAGLFDIR